MPNTIKLLGLTKSCLQKDYQSTDNIHVQKEIKNRRNGEVGGGSRPKLKQTNKIIPTVSFL